MDLNTDLSVSSLLDKYWLSVKDDAKQNSWYAEYIPFHKKRYQESIKSISALIAPGKKALELGGNGPFSYVFTNIYKDVQLDYIDSDLRKPFDIKSDSYDLIMNMEVVEHIKDTENASLDRIDFDGLKSFLSECYRVLKPGGKMLITTPNAGSYNNLNNFFNHESSFMWKYHFREYTVQELIEFVKESGFSISNVKTINVWPQRYDNRYTRIIRFLDRLKKVLLFRKATDIWRGDNIFLVCKKK